VKNTWGAGLEVFFTKFVNEKIKIVPTAEILYYAENFTLFSVF
jgi:hypothetical protein